MIFWRGNKGVVRGDEGDITQEMIKSPELLIPGKLPIKVGMGDRHIIFARSEKEPTCISSSPYIMIDMLRV